MPNGDTHVYLRERVPAGSRPGPILNSQGERVGTQTGFAHYTLGQRKGLGVAVGVPLYVRQIRPSDNALVVGTASEIKVRSIRLGELSFVGRAQSVFRTSVVTRYRGKEATATVRAGGATADVEFDDPQPPAAPGQSAVFYTGDEVLGGGTVLQAA